MLNCAVNSIEHMNKIAAVKQKNRSIAGEKLKNSLNSEAHGDSFFFSFLLIHSDNQDKRGKPFDRLFGGSFLQFTLCSGHRIPTVATEPTVSNILLLQLLLLTFFCPYCERIVPRKKKKKKRKLHSVANVCKLITSVRQFFLYSLRTFSLVVQHCVRQA